MNKLPFAIVVSILALGFGHTATALTLKSGQVLSSDGQVYDGANPDQQEALIAKSKEKGWFGADGKKSGVQGSNVYVVVQDELVLCRSRKFRANPKRASPR